MPTAGWKQLLAGWPWFEGEGSYPIAAYSEFMPPPRLSRRPYGTIDRLAVDKAHVDGNLVIAPAWPAHPQWLAKFLHVLGTRIEP